MKFGILGAMEAEVKNIREKIENVEIKEISGFKFYQGSYKGKDIVVTECSIGKVNSTICTQIMINNFDPDFIINTGIAGGLDKRLEVLSMVVGERLTYHDFDHGIMVDYFPHQEYFFADKKAVDIVERLLSVKGMHFVTGTIVTGDLFVEDSKKKDELVENFNAACVEMEGAAIANTAFINKKPFIVLRAISDLANDGGSMTYYEFKEAAASRSAELVLDLIEEY